MRYVKNILLVIMNDMIIRFIIEVRASLWDRGPWVLEHRRRCHLQCRGGSSFQPQHQGIFTKAVDLTLMRHYFYLLYGRIQIR